MLRSLSRVSVSNISKKVKIGIVETNAPAKNELRFAFHRSRGCLHTLSKTTISATALPQPLNLDYRLKCNQAGSFSPVSIIDYRSFSTTTETNVKKSDESESESESESSIAKTANTKKGGAFDEEIDRKKRLLMAEIIREIKSDLIEADVNKDGKLDAEELKMVLRKYPKVFSDRDIVEIGELFYVAKAGGDVSHEKFLEAVQQVTLGKDDLGEGVEHPRAGTAPHPLGLGSCGTEFMFGKNRGLYSTDELDVKLTHVKPVTTSDKIALFAVRIVRLCFDAVSLWKFGQITQAKVLRRVIFLETVAAVPGFVAAASRHFKSLRSFTRDGGMLNMFLDEANNERMHLLSFVKLKQPGQIFRYVVMASQVAAGIGFYLLYVISPAFCHRFVGYIEEEACDTYTKIIKEIETADPEKSDMAEWRTQKAPGIAISYWKLGKDATVLDMCYAVRADEAEHRDVNHVCSGIREGQVNPLYNPTQKFDIIIQKYVKAMLDKEEAKSTST